MKKLWRAIQAALGIIPKHIDEYSSDALRVTRRMKQLLGSPEAALITDIIPSNWDNALRARLLAALEQTIPALQIVEDCKGRDFDGMLACWIDNLSKLSPSLQATILQKTQSLLTRYQDNSAEKQNLYDLISQYVYSRESKKND